MINKILSNTNILNKSFVLSIFSLSILSNIKLYNENLLLKKEKSEMFLVCKNSINNYVKYINEIKSK
jgi:hypothetical protein